MKKSVVILVIAAFCFFALVDDVFACKCAVRGAAERFKEADMVFLGEVVNVELSGEIQSVKFRVLKSWKGIDNDRVTISARAGDGASCGESFIVGQKDLMWVNRRTHISCDNVVKDGEEYLTGKPTLALKPIQEEQETNNTNLYLTIGVVVTASVLLGLIIIAFATFFFWKKKRKSS